ncbi:hypothetical protein PVAP13_8KG352602 [Panicum virgatum]|uniref:Uncharacterized protein n=1 Tax=Panicum virgatum TaxID=38727 RepID=A0A8T0PP97_PANVG|nr:hypothetical protein PVAP13_8KG352602 [Panicum virgatum]
MHGRVGVSGDDGRSIELAAMMAADGEDSRPNP